MDVTVFATLILVLLISCMFIYSTWDKMYRPRNLPPGPVPLPVIGNLLGIKLGELVKSLNQLGEKYGSIYTLYFGSRPVVILTGYQMVKDALIDHGDDFSNRGQMPTVDRFFQAHGMILSNGERWKQLRRFTLMTLRNFGMGKRSIEERIQEEAHFLVEELKTYKQKPINPTNILVQAVSNVICSVVFGSRFEYANLKFLKLLNVFNETFKIMSSTWGQLHDMIPEITNHIPGPHQKINKLLGEILVFVTERVKMNQESLDPSNPRDFIDCFLIKMDQEKQNPNSEFNTKNLMLSVIQLFFAGTETISSTLRHGFLILLRHPEIEAKLHEEIDRVIGENRCPNTEDRSKMPYTDAVIHEIQRFSDVLPLNLPHSTVKDITFHGYTIPKIGAQHGPVFTFYFGQRPVVVLNGYQAVKEALIDQGEEFSGRGKMNAIDKIFQGFGVAFSNGGRWKELRRFSLTTLRNFGMGKRSIEERIQEESHCLMEAISKYKQRPVDPRNILSQAVSNVICSVVFGNRFEYDDLKFLKLLNFFNETFIVMSSTWGQLHELIPNIMNYVPGPHQKIYPIIERLLEFIAERIKMNEATIDPTSPRDYIDCFIAKMQQDNENPTSEYNMRNLLMTVLNLFFAGTETVSSTLRHGFLILLKYPEIQEKLHKEIDSVIGHNRSPNIEDRSKMPYMDAVIHEIQRFSDVIPMNLPHTVIKDTKLRGFTIPKGTDVYPLLCTVLRDPSQFTTPEQFNPGHFLDESGSFKKSDAFMPFSTGKRICLGEGLARMELFLFLTTVLQNFTLTSETQFTERDIAPRMTGFANVPIDYQLSFIPRGALVK